MALRFPNHPYYIPIIKWQSWEQRALLQTRGDVKPYVRPCIEVRHSNQHSSLVGNFQTAWGAPALVDYANPEGRLVGIRPLEFEAFLQIAKANCSGQLIPDTSIGGFNAIARSYTVGGRYPSFECSRSLL